MYNSHANVLFPLKCVFNLGNKIKDRKINLNQKINREMLYIKMEKKENIPKFNCEPSVL